MNKPSSDEWVPKEYQPILDNLRGATETVRNLWRYAIVLILVDERKARVIESVSEGDTEYLVMQMNDGEPFSIVRPKISPEKEQILRELVCMTGK